jgi:hypothetical protein
MEAIVKGRTTDKTIPISIIIPIFLIFLIVFTFFNVLTLFRAGIFDQKLNGSK